jgi:signal transduction histidine kinase
VTHADAERSLTSSQTHERLAAARFFQRSAQPTDVPYLVRALRNETVGWIRHALESAILLAQGGQQARAIESSDASDDKERDEAYSRGVEDATKRFLHEVGRIAGMVRVHASREILGFEASGTLAQLDRLRGMLLAMQELTVAAQGAARESFDLPAYLRLIASDVTSELRIETSGPSSLQVVGSRALVDLIIGNALKNAVEATVAAGSTSPVVMTWDFTEVDIWVAVLDRGVGLPPAFQRAFEIGTTSKASHFGMGLAIAGNAARSLDGTVTLRPRADGGVVFELRWPGLPDETE